MANPLSKSACVHCRDHLAQNASLTVSQFDLGSKTGRQR
jgi:hypothetical protein